MSPDRRRALTLATAMAATGALAVLGRPVPRTLSDAERFDLDAVVPDHFASWQIDPASQAFVRPAAVQGKRLKIYDQLLERTFVRPDGGRVMLSIAYGSEQSARLQLHRPEVCYRAGGFQVRGVQPVRLDLGPRHLPATRLVAEMPGRPEPITYWTVLGGEVVADADAFRWRRIQFAARREVLDGVLVRVSSIDPAPVRAYALQQQFAQDLLAALPPEATRRLAGAPNGP
jgi:EpsI family protein